jgi:hypothetical protein
MALTSCPKCSGQVPDQAATCPRCGYSLRQSNAQPTEDWRERFREIHGEKGLVKAIQYLRNTKVEASDIRAFLEQEKIAGRIAKLPE